MNITGTTIHYYFYCKRKCWLSLNRLNMEDNSEDVRIGKVMHEIRAEKSKNTEIQIDNIKLDKVTREYVEEVKKSNADLESSLWQLRYYLYVLKSKGIEKEGRLVCMEKKSKDKKIVHVSLTPENVDELNRVIEDIKLLMKAENIPPIACDLKKCKKCSYNIYCLI